MSGRSYLRGFWVGVALVRGDGVDAGHDDGVLFVKYVAVVEGVFLILCRSEVAVAVLRTRERDTDKKNMKSRLIEMFFYLYNSHYCCRQILIPIKDIRMP